MIQKFAGRFGHRGMWLIVMGSIWLVFGVGVLLADPAMPDRPYVLHDQLPNWAQAIMWIGSGGLALLIGSRGPGVRDAWGHVALYVVPAVWAASFTAGWLVWIITAGARAAGAGVELQGFSTGWYSGLVWSVIVVMIRLVSSWKNPTSPIIPTPPPLGPDDAGEPMG